MNSVPRRALSQPDRKQLARIYAFVLKAGEAKRTATETERGQGNEKENKDIPAKKHSAE